jgi:flagellar biosynthetic protein FlhB
MADDTGEKTEPPTPRRRQEARKKGQIPRSQDLSATVVLLAGLVVLELLGPKIWLTLLQVMRSALGGEFVLSGGSLASFACGVAVAMAKVIWPFLLGLVLAALLVMYAQIGGVLTAEKIKPSLDKINPLSGIKRLFSTRKLVETVMNVGKLLVVSAVAYLTIVQYAGPIINAMTMDHMLLYAMLGDLVFRLGIRLAVVMLVLALIDYAYQRWQQEKELKMSKQEVKEELRRMDGDPVIKRRRRQVQLDLALQRIRSAVPKADVIVSNPTHLAIALQYDPERMHAPKVVAKGADYVALRIRQIAAAAGVPIVERKELVRAMYDVVTVGREIPERFYQAIAEILAYVYELTGSGMGPRAVSVA